MKTILVTGAGTGVGAAIAAVLAKDGFRLVLAGRRAAKLEEVRAGLVGPGRHAVAPADVSDAEAFRSALAGALGGQGSLFAVVANAGVGGENSYGDGDRWDELLRINLTGTYVTVNEALPYLRRRDGGFAHVVVVSSILARLGVPGYSGYCASKAGLLGLTRSWAAAFAGEKILVNAVCPGWVDTAMAREGLEALAEKTGTAYEEARTGQMALVPLGKMSEPAEVAALVRFLLSGEQSSFTGQTLDLNNGALMP